MKNYLAKIISQSGYCSRRKAIDLVKTGNVTVNNVLVSKPEFLVSEQDEIVCAGTKISSTKKLVTLLFFKPVGLVCSNSDELNRFTVFDYLKEKGFEQTLFCVGRLDKDSRGLLLITNDGDFAQKMAHPKYEVIKEYFVTLNKPFAKQDLVLLKNGVLLTDGFIKPDEVIQADKKELIITLHSGKNRIVRRMLASLGYEVVDLLRTKFGDYSLDGLKEGMTKLL